MSSSHGQTSVPSTDTSSWLESFYATTRARQRGGGGRPFVTLTFAQSIDGKIAGRQGEQLLLSGKESMSMTHILRARHASILVGSGTVLNDDPQLSARIPELIPVEWQPRPVVLDTHLRTPITAKLVRNGQSGVMPKPVLVCKPGGGSEAARKSLEERGAVVHEVSLADDGKLDLQELLARPFLGESLMVEGGAGVISSFLQQGLFDLLIITIAPVIVGDGVSAVKSGESYPALEHVDSRQFGRDTVMVLRPSSSEIA